MADLKSFVAYGIDFVHLNPMLEVRASHTAVNKSASRHCVFYRAAVSSVELIYFNRIIFLYNVHKIREEKYLSNSARDKLSS